MAANIVLLCLLALAMVAVLVLIIRCVGLQSNLSRRADESTHLQSQLRVRLHDLEQLQSQLSTRSREFEQLQTQFNNRVQQAFTVWREREMKATWEQYWKLAQDDARNALNRWQRETEERIRADAIKRSTAVVAGQVTEHLIPHMGLFPYNPKDARFLGAPVDLIVFEGMSEGDVRQVIFLEVKTNSSTLSTRERRIRDAIVEGRVAWQELRITR